MARVTGERDAKIAEARDATQRATLADMELIAQQMLNEALSNELADTKRQLALATRVATPPLMRIWGGKYTRPEYRAVGKKIGGTAVGFIAEEVHPSKRKQYMAKSGIPKDQHEISETLTSRREGHYRSYLAIMKELIAAHLYTLFGHGTFYVPKHRLRMMDVLNPYTREN